MPYRTYWYRQPDILVLEHTGYLGAEELAGATREALHELADKTVYFIVDLRRVTETTPNPMRVASETKSFIEFVNHRNAGYFTIVGPPKDTILPISVFYRGAPVKVFDGLYEAAAFLESFIFREAEMTQLQNDLVTAYVIYDWLRFYMPRRVDGWELPTSIDVRALADQLQRIFPRFGDLLVGEIAVAQAAMARDELQDVALLEAGIPTPLHPEPALVCCYADHNPVVLGEAEQAGYTVCRVDVRHKDEVANLQGCQVVVALGVLYMLLDDDFTLAFENLKQAGINKVIFSHIDKSEIDEQDVIHHISLRLISRTPAEIHALLPAGWRVTTCERGADYLADVDVVGQRLADLPNVAYVYEVERMD